MKELAQSIKVNELVQSIKDFYKQNSNFPKLNIATTGGGTYLVQSLFEEPGASSVVNNIEIPYSQKAFQDSCDTIIKQELRLASFKQDKFQPCTKYCSMNAAFRLAYAQFLKDYNSEEKKHNLCIGIACSLNNKVNATTQREGRVNTAYVCIISNDQNTGYGIVFDTIKLNSNDTRLAQDKYIARIVLAHIKNILDSSKNTPGSYRYSFISGHDNMPIYETLMRLFNGDITTIYSGTFNPFHKAHKYIADYKVADSLDVYTTGTILEIPYFSVGKNEQERISPSVSGYNVIRTSAMYFIDKIKNIKAMLSVTTNKLYLKMGSDTLNRISNEDLQTLTNEYVDNIIVFMREGLKMSAIAEKIDNCKCYSIFVMPDELKTISSTEIRNSEPIEKFNQFYISPFEEMGGKVTPNDYQVPCNTTEKDK